MNSLVVRKVIIRGAVKLRLVQVDPRCLPKEVVKLERGQVTCPACGETVEAVAGDGQVKGYCAVARQYVDFLFVRKGRDSRGRFVKGNVPSNKRRV